MFERKFAEYAGLSPKIYSRIIRFQASLTQYGKWLQIIDRHCLRMRAITDSVALLFMTLKSSQSYHPGQYFWEGPRALNTGKCDQ